MLKMGIFLFYFIDNYETDDCFFLLTSYNFFPRTGLSATIQRKRFVGLEAAQWQGNLPR